MKKIRADQLLAERGLAESREKAKRLIMAGQVLLERDGRREPLDKPGRMLPPETCLSVVARPKYVSRGGEKLATALEHFQISVKGKVALDVGASTGGFVDCLLQYGAALVYAVDVGKGLIDQRLREDGRVRLLEGVNFRHAGAELLGQGVKVDLAVVDVSFISLELILPPCLFFLKEQAEIIALVKPQFEVGPHMTVKGIVRDEQTRLETVRRIADFAARELRLAVIGHTPSNIKGSKGNQEYLLYLKKP